jgi:hypothetical protein
VSEEHPNVADLQAVSSEDLQELVWQLLQSQGRPPAIIASEGPASLRVEEPEPALIVVHRAGGGRSPLAGVSLTALRRQLIEADVRKAIVVTTGTYTVAQRAALELAIAELRPIEIDVLEGSSLLDWLTADTATRRAFFPNVEEASDAQEHINAGLVRFGAGVLPREPATTPKGARGTILPLAWTVALVVVLISVPLEVDARCARIIGLAGIGIVALSVLGGYALGRWFERPMGVWRGAPLSALIPIPDATTMLRALTRDPTWTGKKFCAFLLIAVPLKGLTFVLRTGLMFFFAFFASVFLLLWGIDSTAFVGTGTHPSVGDFLYMAVQAAFFNQPADLAPVSRVARAAATGEFLVAATLVVSYAAALGLADDGRAADGARSS